MWLVERIASQFVRRLPRSVQRDDLVAAGALGLLHALRSTTHTSPAMFAAYASIRIRGAMVDELRRHDWSPRRRKSRVATEGSAPSNVMSVPPGSLASIRPVAHTVAVVSFEDLPVGAMAGLAAQGLSPLEDVLVRRERDELRTAVQQLPEREREIVCMRYLEGLPSKAIAQTMRLSEARISQLHSRAMGRLREILAAGAEEFSLAA